MGKEEENGFIGDIAERPESISTPQPPMQHRRRRQSYPHGSPVRCRQLPLAAVLRTAPGAASAPDRYSTTASMFFSPSWITAAVIGA